MDRATRRRCLKGLRSSLLWTVIDALVRDGGRSIVVAGVSPRGTWNTTVTASCRLARLTRVHRPPRRPWLSSTHQPPYFNAKKLSYRGDSARLRSSHLLRSFKVIDDFDTNRKKARTRATSYWWIVTVTVTEALVLHPLLEDRGRITESIRIRKVAKNINNTKVPSISQLFLAIAQYWSRYHKPCKLASSLAPRVNFRLQFPVQKCNESPRPTQPGHPFMGRRRRSEYQPKDGDALQLVSKGRYGSYVGGR